MTVRLTNDPHAFADEVLEAFARLHPEQIVPVTGGVLRSEPLGADRVGVVTGGGSGHYPAFAGLVGPGLAAAAVCGGMFAAPSDAQIAAVARGLDPRRGLLFLPINYTGDILHFTAAADRLRGEGVDVRLVPVADDIASAPLASRGDRRGVAGSFLVLKIVGAAAEAGWLLDDLERLAVRVEGRTRSLGVAFSGCALPGQDGPLFTVPEGRMAVGLGIHGEPGLREVGRVSADEVADLLVDGILEELPVPVGARVAVLVNGLGATPHEELFIVAARVIDRLEAEGAHVPLPVVDGLVTSLDMAGISLSLCVLDDDDVELWEAEADAVAFRRTRRGTAARRPAAEDSAAGAGRAGSPRPGRVAAPQAASLVVVGALDAARRAVVAAEDALAELDAVAGDGDHGNGMVLGVTAAHVAASEAAARGEAPRAVLNVAADSWSAAAGGTSGALWAAGLRAAAAAVDDAVPLPTLAEAVAAFASAVSRTGGCGLGDKTMFDAIEPFRERLASELSHGAAPAEGWRAAAAAAADAAQGTASLTPRKGRARTHGERGIGSPDPGATSFALIVAAIGGDR